MYLISYTEDVRQKSVRSTLSICKTCEICEMRSDQIVHQNLKLPKFANIIIQL